MFKSANANTTLKARLQAACIGAGGSLAVLFLFDRFGSWLAAGLTDAPPDVILSWTDSGPVGAALVLLGLLVSALAGGYAMRMGRVWPFMLAPWTLAAALGLLSSLPQFQSQTMVTAQEVRIRCGWPCEASHTFSLRDVTAVEVRCRVISRRKQPDIWTIDYRLEAAGDRINLSEARPRNPAGAREWFRAVADLDTQSLSDVPHRSTGSHRVNCIRGLADALGPSDFVRARAILGISDADWLSKYAPPAEAWEGKLQHGE